MSDTASVKLEAGWAVIRLPQADRDQLMADLAECPCRAPKSAATAEERAWLREQLAELPVRVPLHRIHGLRVALNSCPCTGPTAAGDTIRERLNRALGRLK